MLDLYYTKVQGAFAPMNTTVRILLYLSASSVASTCWKAGLPATELTLRREREQDLVRFKVGGEWTSGSKHSTDIRHVPHSPCRMVSGTEKGNKYLLNVYYVPGLCLKAQNTK